MRNIEYRNILKPSVEYLSTCETLLLRTNEMAHFLQIPKKAVVYLASTDRIPMPLRLGFGNHTYWSVLELLEWVEAGCPRRALWHAMLRRRCSHRVW
jgi:predicted DNA-binding transcriptional regulator AlpA